ncbi:hypothetical protein WA026_003221 [Henosepilachna vigintioctopunctata]|uniref:Uncharacterized protein n=1 Tax=Henosepilachna vigintioctopunctata TaxID=420089 RepID=A0AAW1TMQ7_9CUCU
MNLLCFQNSAGENVITKKTLIRIGQLLIFYLIFYAILAALFAICMQGLMATIDDVEPKWTQGDSLIGENPGLGFRPLPAKTEDGALIWYNDKNKTTSEKWINLMDEFLKPYLQNTTGKNMIPCDYTRSPTDGQVCIVDTTLFSHCSPENNYGYNTPSPCVFLKLNRIWGWEPKYYTEATEDMPEQLVIAINGTNEEERQNIWISCEGEGPADKEHVQQFEYFPHQGFPGYYYPFRNVKNYLSPLIAVRILNPTPNVIVNIECRAWAKNIEYASGNLNREGSVHFELMVDSKASS